MKNPKKLLALLTLTILGSITLAGTAFAGDPILIEESMLMSEDLQFVLMEAQLQDVVFEPIVPDDPSDPYTNDPGIFVELEGALTQDGRAALHWTPYLEPNFSMYKIVHDQFDEDPYYPKHGYLEFYEEPAKTGYLSAEIPEGDNFFRICVITTDDKRGCSNTIALFKEPFIEEEPFMEPEPEPEPEPGPGPEIEERPPRDEIPRDEILERERLAKEQANGGFLNKLSKFLVDNVILLLTIAAVTVAVSGFTFAARKKQRSISKYMNKIDDTYSEYKMKAKRCEAELYRLKDIIDEELKTAKIDDSAYQLLMGRIENYMVDIQKQIVNEKFGGLPASLKDQMFKMMEDGEITETEFDTIQKLIKRSELSVTEQDNLLETIKDFKKQDEIMKKKK